MCLFNGFFKPDTFIFHNTGNVQQFNKCLRRDRTNESGVEKGENLITQYELPKFWDCQWTTKSKISDEMDDEAGNLCSYGFEEEEEPA